MSNIVASSSGPDQLSPITCAPWCLDGTGHPDATHPAEQRCRSYLHRLDTTIGGGRDADQSVTSSGGLYLQAEESPGQTPTYVLGIELGGTEQWIQLLPAELLTLIRYARTLLDQSAA